MLTDYQKRAIVFEDGGVDFQSEDQCDKMVTIELTNADASATAKTIAICPGDGYTATELSTLLGFEVHGVLKDGEVVATAGEKVIGSCMPGKALSFLKAIRRNPRRFTGVAFKVNDTDQLSQPLKLYNDDPVLGSPRLVAELTPAQHESENQQNDKLISIPINHLQFDANTIAIVTLIPNAKLTLRLNPGAKIDIGKALSMAALDEFASKGLVRQRKQK